MRKMQQMFFKTNFKLEKIKPIVNKMCVVFYTTELYFALLIRIVTSTILVHHPNHWIGLSIETIEYDKIAKKNYEFIQCEKT